MGGGERNLFNILREMSKEHEVELWCPGGKLANRARSIAGLKVNELDWLAKKRWLRGLPLKFDRKRAIEKAVDFDLIHTYSINVLPLFKPLANKVIHTVHGFWERPYGLRAKNMQSFLRFALPVSQDVFNQCTLKNDSLKLVHLGVEIDEFEKIETSAPEKEVSILCMARFQKIKGQDLLLDALKEIEKACQVDFVGGVNSSLREDEDYFKNCQTKAKEIKNHKINFHGFQNNPRDFYKKASFVIIPSRYESFGMVAVESLASGIPVIAPEVGGLIDIINKDVGMFFSSGDSHSLKESLAQMIENYSQFDKGKLRQRANEFTIQSQVKKLNDVYNKVIRG